MSETTENEPYKNSLDSVIKEYINKSGYESENDEGETIRKLVEENLDIVRMYVPTDESNIVKNSDQERREAAGEELVNQLKKRPYPVLTAMRLIQDSGESGLPYSDRDLRLLIGELSATEREVSKQGDPITNIEKIQKYFVGKRDQLDALDKKLFEKTSSAPTPGELTTV